MASNQITYISNYNKKNYKMYQFRVKKNNNELIEKLDSISNRNSYITNLILLDINPSVLTIKQIKEKIKPIIEKHKVKEVYLFGSYARGDANNNSDIDIYCDNGDINTLFKIEAFKEELEEVLGKKLMLLLLDLE